MRQLLVLAPLRVEAAAARGSGGRVLRTGMGAARARVAAARALAVDADAVAVAGVCGAVARGLAAGDVVVATELRRDDGPTAELHDPRLLVSALERRGLRVHAGPLLSVDRMVGAAERQALAATGALAVDMESAWLADGAGDRPLAVVRAVADAAGRSLWDPRMLVAGTRALIELRRSAPALAEWAAAAAPPRDLDRQLVALLPRPVAPSRRTGAR